MVSKENCHKLELIFRKFADIFFINALMTCNNTCKRISTRVDKRIFDAYVVESYIKASKESAISLSIVYYISYARVYQSMLPFKMYS